MFCLSLDSPWLLFAESMALKEIPGCSGQDPFQTLKTGLSVVLCCFNGFYGFSLFFSHDLDISMDASWPCFAS